jgi:hypothetical protein
VKVRVVTVVAVAGTAVVETAVKGAKGKVVDGEGVRAAAKVIVGKVGAVMQAGAQIRGWRRERGKKIKHY